MEDYHAKLKQTINLVLETDLPHVHPIQYSSIFKMKRLLGLIAESVPFTPNMAKLGSQIGSKRDTLVQYLVYLNDAGIIRLLYDLKTGVNKLNKPGKIFLDNANIAYALSGLYPDVGSLRESFFVNQLRVQNEVWFSKTADFVVGNDLLFEIGGKTKTASQLKGAPQGWIAADNLEIGLGNKIPLWLFGMLY